MNCNKWWIYIYIRVNHELKKKDIKTPYTRPTISLRSPGIDRISASNCIYCERRTISAIQAVGITNSFPSIDIPSLPFVMLSLSISNAFLNPSRCSSVTTRTRVRRGCLVVDVVCLKKDTAVGVQTSQHILEGDSRRFSVLPSAWSRVCLRQFSFEVIYTLSAGDYRPFSAPEHWSSHVHN